jgi:hypothetical protein
LSVGYYATPSFYVSNNVARHVATEQLHFGGEKFLRPACPIPKLGHVLSDDISIPGHTYTETQGRSRSSVPATLDLRLGEMQPTG